MSEQSEIKSGQIWMRNNRPEFNMGEFRRVNYIENGKAVLTHWSISDMEVVSSEGTTNFSRMKLENLSKNFTLVSTDGTNFLSSFATTLKTLISEAKAFLQIQVENEFQKEEKDLMDKEHKRSIKVFLDHLNNL